MKTIKRWLVWAAIAAALVAFLAVAHQSDEYFRQDRLVCGDVCLAYQYIERLESDLLVERVLVNQLLREHGCVLDAQELGEVDAGGLIITYQSDTWEILWVRSGAQDTTDGPLNLCTDQPWAAVPMVP